MPSTDLRKLGRLGRCLDHSSSGRLEGARHRRSRLRVERTGVGTRRRGAVPRWLLSLLLVGLAGVAWLGTAAARQSDPLAFLPAAPTPHLTAAEVVERPRERVARSRVDVSQPVFATVDDLHLHLPGPHAVLVAFGEAATGEALAMQPVGRLIANDSPDRFAPGEDTAGPGYRVLAPGPHATAPTGSVDVVLASGAAVRAPVSGQVADVSSYPLPGGGHDWRIALSPDAHPELAVVVVHMTDVRVEPGDRVEAGATVLGAVRPVPFAAPVDDVLEAALPYVHIEVKPARAQAPVDPNAPALPADARG